MVMEKYIQDFEMELRTLNLNENLEKDLMMKAFSQASFYTYIPYELYWVLKPHSVSYEKITKLAVASYLYFSLIVFLDKLSDGQTDYLPENKPLLISYLEDYILIIHEHVIKKLSSLYPESSGFWADFDKIKRKFLNNEREIIRENNILKILLKKSCLAETYRSAFYHLVDERERTPEFIEILNRFARAMNDCHIAFQLFDDYKDIKEDLVSGQLNYFIYEGRKFRKRYSNNLAFLKSLYVSGIIPHGMELARKYAGQATEEFRSIGLRILSNCADGLDTEIFNEYSYVCRLIDKTRQKAKYSNKIVNNGWDVNKEAETSLKFLISQLKEHSWEDFLTNAGLGKNWVTGYVLTLIADEGPQNAEVQSTFEKLYKSGGSYNEYIVPDADSTTFLLKAMKAFKIQPSEEYINDWCKFQNKSGGFSTYYNNDIKKSMRMPETSDFKGWFTPQCCVTAAACWAASSYKHIPILKNIYETSKGFLISNQEKRGNWKSYWWTSDIYATSFAILALKDDVDVNPQIIKNALDYIISTQDKEGFWSCTSKEPSTFFTALALNTIIELNIQNKFGNLSTCINKGMSWLRTNQFEDGSWKTTRILRLPYPYELHPECRDDWKRSSFGLNCLVDDHKRVFTTATVYNTLQKYAKYCL